MSESNIYFTVSMWNRMEHFELLLRDLCGIHGQDPRVVLHVVDFCTVPAKVLRNLATQMPFTMRFWQIDREFCNGMGHNFCIRKIEEGEALVAVIAVDLQMPPDITKDIRKHAVPRQSFYGPEVRYQCRDGRLKRCSAAYALIAADLYDIRRAGRLQQNMMWGGDRREGGEDIALMKRLKRRLKQRRPFHEGLICRWHLRNVEQRYYQSYHRYGNMPWWDLVDSSGKPVERKGK